MIKNDINEVINDLRARRDALSLAHEDLKSNNDKWNGVIIVLSLITGMIESIKIKLNINNDFMALIPILMSSVVASISALIKFKKYPEQMETIVQSSSLLTNTLTKCRNETELTDAIRKEYHNSLQALETSLYPDLRKKFLKQSHKNLLCILKQEQDYYKNIDKVNRGEKIDIKCDSGSDGTPDLSIKHVNSFIEDESVVEEKNVEIEMNELDLSNHRTKTLEVITE